MTSGEPRRTAQDWRDRADEARAQAADMRDVIAKATMLQIAHSYEAMADRIIQKEAKPGS